MSRNIETGLGGQEQEGGESPEFPEITAEFLAEILIGQNFLNRLRQAWEISRKTNHEAGFVIALDQDSGKTRWGGVMGSLETVDDSDFLSMGVYKKIILSLKMPEPINKVLLVIDLHTHPLDSVPAPSLEDIQNLFYRRELWRREGLDIYPILAIVIAPSVNMVRS